MLSFKLRFIASVLVAAFFVVASASLSYANPRYAVAAEQARRAAAGQAASNLGAGDGTRSDLRAISAPRQQPQTFTGLPAGSLPGDSMGAGDGQPESRVVLSGERLAPTIGTNMIGQRIDRIAVIAGHVGYTMVRAGFSPTVIDTPYSFTLMNGNRRVSTLYFSRSMTLMAIR